MTSASQIPTIAEGDASEGAAPSRPDSDGRQAYALPYQDPLREDARDERSRDRSSCQAHGSGTPSQRTVRAKALIEYSRSGPLTRNESHRDSLSNLPMTVKEAARFLGVSPQTVYLWVERKQILHFRVMGRNIRFLKSDLKPFRAQFKQEVENGKTA
jgi:excisionase family DNA binding protein